jgi:hypothetical protein
MRFADDGLRADGLEVVAIQRDVERAARDVDPLLVSDELGDSVGQLDAAALNADEQEIGRTVPELEDLHCHTLQRPRHRAGVKENRAFFRFWPRHLGAETYWRCGITFK